MMQFQVHSLDTAPAASRETLSKIAQNYGFLPNLAGVFAESPATLNGLFGLLRIFDSREVTLSPIERQVVLLAVSVANRCEYCAAAHSMLANLYGLDRAEIDNLHQGRPLSDAKLQTLRDFADTIVGKRGWVPEADIEKFIAAGFTRAQILEVILGVALKTLTNYTNHIAKPPANPQFSALLPKWANAA